MLRTLPPVLSGVYLLACSCFFGCGGPASVEEVELERTGDGWNVIMIVVDTLRQDRLSAYGYERHTSPNLDRFAAGGALVDGVSPTSWTKPATVSILTGLHPLRHQAYSRNDLLSDEVVTLAEMLSDNGYMTVGLSANLWISHRWNVAQGFDVFHDMGGRGYGHVATADKVNEAIMPLLEPLAPPFFLYVHYVDPHVPYEPPCGWSGAPLPRELADRVPMDLEDFGVGFRHRDPELLQAASDLYDGEVRFVDQMIGEIMQVFDDRGLLETTITVITADHGEEFEDHGRMGHGHTVFTEQTDVPLIFYAPSLIPPGQRLPRASLMDIVPTLREILALDEVPADGISLAAALVNNNPTVLPDDREFLIQLDIDSGRGLALERDNKRVVITEDPYFKGFFELNEDPNEQNNRLGERFAGRHFGALSKRLVELYHELQDTALPRTQSGDVEPEIVDALQALGYALNEEQDGTRWLPGQIGPADGSPGGLLGFEDTSEFSSCIKVGTTATLPQLLLGWHEARHENGRWTWPEATAVLSVPEGSALELRVAGKNFRKDKYTLSAWLEDKLVFEVQPGPGKLEVTKPISNILEPGTLARLRLAVDQAYYPWQHGQKDNRTVGVFLSELCIAPADGT